ncbi:MAG: hypothetical protein R2704_05365 [Microthrixaceae bacterium]|nr:EcsC family protein [Microthrixaceae bacterium]
MAGAIDRIFHPAIERVARTRYHPAREMVDELHQRYRPGNADELIKLIVKRYTRELAAVSALAGGAAAIPGAGTGTALMTSTADLAYSITKMGEMILAIGIAAGHDAQSLEQRRSWVVSVLTMANGASAGVEGLAGRLGSAGGARVVGSLSDERLSSMNAKLSAQLLTKFGIEQGALRVGRLVPFGIGAGIGATGSALITRSTAKAARRFFQHEPDGRTGSDPLADDLDVVADGATTAPSIEAQTLPPQDRA